MTFYSLVLFVHVTAALALFAALTFEVLSLFHLRRASTLTEVHLWLDPVPRLPLAAMGSLLVVFFSGIHLTIRLSAFGEAWPKVTIAALHRLNCCWRLPTPAAGDPQREVMQSPQHRRSSVAPQASRCEGEAQDHCGEQGSCHREPPAANREQDSRHRRAARRRG